MIPPTGDLSYISDEREVEATVVKDVVLTPEGLEKLKKEIDYLSTEKRKEIAAHIKEAREFGDISENAEYEYAKNDQAILERKIARLEQKLRKARIVDTAKIPTDRVEVGSKVRVKDQKSGKSIQYQIVGSAEADPGENKLSNESPVGSSLLGKKKGETVAVDVPRGPKRKLKITKIEAN